MKTFTANDIVIWPLEIKCKKHETVVQSYMAYV